MDKSDRARYKQLANDSIIATYGRDDNEARLAQALEDALDQIDFMCKRPHCATCDCEYDTREQA